MPFYIDTSVQEHDDILKRCQEELRRYYLDDLCKIPLFPGDYDSCVDLKDIYTKLSFQINLPTPCKPVKMPLTSYTEMFTRKSIEGRLYTRFLLSAPAGLGKTTLTAKIAYDWATKAERVLKDIALLFVINMRSVDRTSNLEDVILSQIFPKDTTVTPSQIQSLIQRYSKSTIVILDAVDESDRKLYDPLNRGTIVELLRGEILLSCKLLATTRPWRISEITKRCQNFAHVEICGFNKDDIREYINKFFSNDKDLRDSLIKHAKQNRLIDDIAYIPLMSLLICVYWKEVKEESIPHRVGQLYDAIINIMNDHYLRKQSFTASPPENDDDDDDDDDDAAAAAAAAADDDDDDDDDGDIQELVCRMGKMALEGFWPPENRVVFTPGEMSSSDDVEKACKIGFLSKQESRPSIIKTSGRKKTTLTFFHKTCGEKCAGKYLASLAKQNTEELKSKLSRLKTVQDALSVRLILQFACSSSTKAADLIIRRLTDIFNSDKSLGTQKMMMHTFERLELKETLMIQDFFDLCLRCNYEADCKAEFNDLLKGFFPVKPVLFDENGQPASTGLSVLFLGISAFTSVALSYYLSNSQPGHWSITLRPAAHPCDIYVMDYGPLVNIMKQAQREINHLAVKVIQNICREYIDKHPDMHETNKSTVNWSPSLLLSQIRMWQACEGLPTAEESDVGPIFKSTKQICVEELDLTSFNVPESNIDQLLKMIRKGNLSHLLGLKLGMTSMNENQMRCLARELKKMPDLQLLDVSQAQANMAAGQSNGGVAVLAESLPSMKSLHKLYVDNVAASAQDMARFVQKFPEFASQLIELRMTSVPTKNGFIMNDSNASQLTMHLPIANRLRKFVINLDFLSLSTQNNLLSALIHLTRLFELQIFFFQYPNDVVTQISHVMQSLPGLVLLALSSVEMFKHSVDSKTWRQFKAALLNTNMLTELRLLHLAFKKDDLTDLVSVCREKRYQTFT